MIHISLFFAVDEYPQSTSYPQVPSHGFCWAAAAHRASSRGGPQKVCSGEEDTFEEEERADTSSSGVLSTPLSALVMRGKDDSNLRH